VSFAIVAWLCGRELGKTSDQTPLRGEVQRAPHGGEIITEAQEHTNAPLPITAAELRDAVEQIPKNVPEAEQLATLFQCAERLSPENFPGALQAFAELKDRSGWWRGKLLEIWAERDLRAAKAWFFAQPPAETWKLFNEWGEAWARLDPQGLCLWLRTRPEEERLTRQFASELQRALAEADPEAALALGTLYPRGLARADVLEVWAHRDPVAAATKALEIKDPGNPGYSLFWVMKSWAKQSPENALVWLEGVTDPILAERGRFSVATILADSRGIAVADLIRERYPPGEQNKVLAQIAYGVGVHDPESVVRWAQENAEPRLRQQMIEMALNMMCEKAGDSQASVWPPIEPGVARPTASRLAELWLSECANSSPRERFPKNVFSAIAQQAGLAEAVRFLDRLPQPPALAIKEAVTAVAASRGWPATGEAVFQLPPSPRRTELLAQAIESLANNGDVPAAQTLITRTPERERAPLVRALAAGLMQDDPHTSAQMLLELPAGHDSLRAQLAQWLERDPRYARRWVTATALLTSEEKQQLLAPHP